jgi:putative transposase
LKQTHYQEEPMATTHGTNAADRPQGALLDDSDFLRHLVERTLQEVLEAEMTAHVGAEPYERSESRTGHRNGYRPRTLHTRVGTLTLMVPQDREGTFSTALFARYQRSEKALVLALMEMYLEGVSTRKVADVTEALCGTTFSKSLVSSLVGKLDAELTAWRTRRLDDVAYPYLTVDARYEDVRCDGRIVSQGVLIVAGVREDGKREILAVDVAETESEASYHECFRQLKSRGLQGVELVSSDDHQGLVAAVKRHFQGASWQRCQVHFARGLLGLVGATKRAALGAGLRTVFAAQTIEEARRLARDLADEWRPTHAHVAAHLDEHIEACFAIFAFPPPHRVRLRTTNGVERLNEELKRRTRVVRIFPNREACLRLATALCAEQSDDWVTGKRYLDIGELRQWQRDRASQEVTLTAV